jgi:hypothetical protein
MKRLMTILLNVYSLPSVLFKVGLALLVNDGQAREPQRGKESFEQINGARL